MKIFLIFCLILLTSLNPKNSQAAGIPAFPGAEGFGTQTGGGRGGRVIEVTNLNDNGNGSFRQAVETETGARIVVFKLGGILSPLSKITIQNPYITIAGQTAPGDGIVISGVKLDIKTHDVIIRGLKSRVGIDPYKTSDPDGIGISNSSSQDVSNIIVDHNSITWGIDENASLYNNSSYSNKIHDVTFSWNIMAEGLYCSTHSDEPLKCGANLDKNAHSMGFLLGDYSKNISFHHNLLASNHGRNPLIHGGTTSEIINNVVYNWGEGPTSISDGNNTGQPVLTNLIGNYYQPTAASKFRQNSQKGIYIKCGVSDGSKVFVKGNVGPGRPTDSGDEWGAVTFEAGCDLTAVKTDSPGLVGSGVTVLPAMEAVNQVLAKAGAYTPKRDSTDTRIMAYVSNKTAPAGNKWFVDSPADIGGVPPYSSGVAPVDNDHDGMPDSWETQNGGDLSPTTIAPSGYTWIEEYVNSLFSPLGDANSDSKIDGIDYVIWLNHYNQSVSGPTNGDFNNSGIVDGVDYVIWLNNYGS